MRWTRFAPVAGMAGALAGVTVAGALAHALPAADPGFGNGGVVSDASPLAIEHDGSVVARGPQGRLFRLSPNGSRLPFKLRVDKCMLVLVPRGDGRLVAACGNVLMRLRSDGTIDGGADARVQVPDVTFSAVAVAEDGSVVGAGVLGNQSAVLLRFLQSGAADTSFGTSGRVQLEGPAPAQGGLAIDARDRILVAAGPMRRFDSSGRPDETFGVGGVVTIAGFGAATTSLIPDGRILACCGRTGYSPSGVAYGSGGSTVVRLLDNGAPDGSFGSLGMTVLQSNDLDVYLTGLVSMPDGGAVAVGSAHAPTNAFTTIFMIVRRIGRDGSPGAAGESAGFLDPDKECWDEWADWIAKEPDGKLVVGGGACSGDETDFAMRLTTTLKRDYGPFLTLELNPPNPKVSTGGRVVHVVASLVPNHGARVTAYVRATTQGGAAVTGAHLVLLPGSRLGTTRLARAASAISTAAATSRAIEVRLALRLDAIAPRRDYALIVEARRPHMRYRATVESFFNR